MNKVYSTADERTQAPASKTVMRNNSKGNFFQKENLSSSFMSDWTNQRRLQKNKSLKAFPQSNNLSNLIKHKRALFEAYSSKRSRTRNLKTDDPEVMAMSKAVTSSQRQDSAHNTGGADPA